MFVYGSSRFFFVWVVAFSGVNPSSLKPPFG